MPLEFIKTQKGKDMVSYNGHLFIKDKDGLEGKIYWKCALYKKLKCSSRLHSHMGNLVNAPNDHNHAADPAKATVRTIISEIKERASTTQEATHHIVANSTVGLTVAVQGQLPAIPRLKRIVQRARHDELGAPPNPRSLEELVIPDIYQQTDVGELFLRWDSGPGRILLFATDRNLDLLLHCPHWYADGTFKTAPSLFQQLYTLHGVHYHNVIPSVFALLPNKTEATYNRLFGKLKELRQNLNPTSIMTDFELAAVNSFANEFPDTIRHGCFFHLAQCVYRKVQQVGLQQRYEMDADFGLKVRMIPALAFVPVENVIDAFDSLCENNIMPAEIQPIFDYFEDTWIGRLNRRGQRRQPNFPIEMWNCYESVIDGLPKTNNAVEGWHRGFVETVGAHHPSIFNFIAALKKEQSLNETKIEQFIAGLQAPLGRRRYRDCAERIKRIVDDYANRPLLDYLRGLAHNYNF